MLKKGVKNILNKLLKANQIN